MDASSLVAAATAAQAHLAGLWDAMGVPADERATFLAQMSADAQAIYASRVAGQAGRKGALEAEIAALQATIRDMRVSMEEPGPIVRPAPRRDA